MIQKALQSDVITTEDKPKTKKLGLKKKKKEVNI